MEQTKTTSVERQQRVSLPEVTWEDLNEPGAYVERGSGDLYRIPREALIPGGSPIIHKESSGASRLVQVSKNLFVTYPRSTAAVCTTQHRTQLLTIVAVGRSQPPPWRAGSYAIDKPRSTGPRGSV